MALLALISGVLALAAVVAGTVLVVVRTRELMRGSRAFGLELAGATAGLEEASRRLGEAEPGAESAVRLSASLRRLSVSSARLGVLLAARDDVRAPITRLRTVVPRK